MYHPDMADSDLMKTVNQKKFQQVQDANERLSKWLDSRDAQLTEELSKDKSLNKEDGSLTYKFGALTVRAKVSQLSK